MSGTTLYCVLYGVTLSVSEPTLIDNIWTHVAIVIDLEQDFFGLYLDGELKTFASGQTVQNAWDSSNMQFFDHTILGCMSASLDGSCLTGYIDDFIVLGTALVDAEITILVTTGVTIPDIGCKQKNPMTVYSGGDFESNGEVDYSDCSSFYITSEATANATSYNGTVYDSTSAFCVTLVRLQVLLADGFLV